MEKSKVSDYFASKDKISRELSAEELEKVAGGGYWDKMNIKFVGDNTYCEACWKCGTCGSSAFRVQPNMKSMNPRCGNCNNSATCIDCSWSAWHHLEFYYCTNPNCALYDY